jgi:organic radical activating enzyme
MAGSFFSRLFTVRNRRLWEKLPGPVRRILAPAVRTVVPTRIPMEKIPRVYPTLQCNLRCPFCSDGLDYDKSRMGYEPLSKEQWIGIVDALPGHAVMFTGGEPTLYQDLPDVINAIHQIDVFLYTNLTYDVRKFFDRLTKPVRVFGSFHPNNKSATAERILENMKILADHPMCRGVENLHTINHASNGDVEAHRKTFEDNGIELEILEDQFTNNAHTPAACNHERLQTVRCSYDRVIIGPDGKRWICVSKMIRNCGDGQVPIDQQSVPEMTCSEFGRCSPCDQVAKIEFLKQGAPAEAATGR